MFLLYSFGWNPFFDKKTTPSRYRKDATQRDLRKPAKADGVISHSRKFSGTPAVQRYQTQQPLDSLIRVRPRSLPTVTAMDVATDFHRAFLP